MSEGACYQTWMKYIFFRLRNWKKTNYSIVSSRMTPLQNCFPAFWQTKIYIPLKQPENTLKTSLKHPQTTLKTPSKLPWNTLETSLGTPLKLVWNIQKTLILQLFDHWIYTLPVPSLEVTLPLKIPQSGICPAPCVLRQCTVVFAWKCRLLCLCMYVQCRVCYIYHVEFHVRFRHLVSFPVEHQLWCGCHGEKSSTKNSGNL